MKLLLDILLTLLDDNALIRSVHLLTSEVVDSTIELLASLHSLNSCCIQIDNLDRLQNAQAGKSTTLPKNMNIREAVCGPTLREVYYDLMEISSFFNIKVLLEANTVIPCSEVHLQVTSRMLSNDDHLVLTILCKDCGSIGVVCNLLTLDIQDNSLRIPVVVTSGRNIDLQTLCANKSS